MLESSELLAALSERNLEKYLKTYYAFGLANDSFSQKHIRILCVLCVAKNISAQLNAYVTVDDILITIEKMFYKRYPRGDIVSFCEELKELGLVEHATTDSGVDAYSITPAGHEKVISWCAENDGEVPLSKTPNSHIGQVLH